MELIKAYNAATAAQIGSIVPVEVTIYEDRSFTFELKTPPASQLLRKAAGLDKGGGTPGRATAGSVTKAQVREIAELKMRDLNANTVEAAMKVVEGTARSMGLAVAEG
jgi:large subunit ribosomal protein L11